MDTPQQSGSLAPGTPPEQPAVEPEKETATEQETPQAGGGNNVDARGSEGQYNLPGHMRDANYNKFRDQINNYFHDGDSPHLQLDELKPLIDLTCELPSGGSNACCLEPSLIQEYCETVKTDRVLLISCADKQIALSWACAIADALAQADTPFKKRFLDFERIGRSNVQPTVSLLRATNKTDDERTQENGEVVIVVDIIGRHQETKAQQFLDSLLRTSFLSFNLKREQVSLLCLVDTETIDERATVTIDGETFEDPLPYQHREVPFLRALLKQHFPETYEHVQTKIEQRRECWSANNRRFCRDIRKLIKQNQLLALLETPYTPDEINIEPLFKGDDINQDVRLVVLFVATFCPNLNPREFNRVVSLLLGDRTRTVTVTTTRINDTGIVETLDVKEERSLRELWDQRSDKIREECHIHSIPDTELTRVMEFKDHRLRPLLKQRFEQAHAVFTCTHIERLFAAGLLFDTSPRIGESLTAITAAAAASDPDYYGTELVVDTVSKLKRAFESDDAGPIHKLTPFQLLVDLDETEASLRVYPRVSSLLRTLLERYKLQPAVRSLMEQLVRRELYEAVFQIVGRLRFTQGFDEYHWLKQLLERGDDEIKTRTLTYLYARLRGMGPRVHESLARLDGWLPKYERKKEPPTTQQKPANYSGKYALVLLMAYCLETTEDLDASDYGAWPSRHPLFVFADAETATSSLAVLARWLFHPWMKDAFPEDETNEQSGDIQDLICDLIFHWMLVLIGPPRDERDRQRVERPNTGVDAITVSRILIHQVAVSANEEQHQHMLAQWQRDSNLMLSMIKTLPYGDEVREVFIWQRSLLDDLIIQFKDHADAAESSRAA